MDQTKKCTDCKEHKLLIHFYKSATHSQGVMCYCKICFNKRSIQRWIKRKTAAIQYKGSICEKCGLHLKNSHYSVFEFHHTGHLKKEDDWSTLRLKSWAKIQKELDKCLLLCANCHRIVHAEDFPDQPRSHR